MNSCELVSFVTAISCAIAKCVPEKELPTIASIFGQIASTLATITVHEEAAKQTNTPAEVLPEPDTIIDDPNAGT